MNCTKNDKSYLFSFYSCEPNRFRCERIEVTSWSFVRPCVCVCEWCVLQFAAQKRHYPCVLGFASSFHAFKIQKFFSLFFFVPRSYRHSDISHMREWMAELAFFSSVFCSGSIRNAAQLHEPEHPCTVVMKHAIKITWPYLQFRTLRFRCFHIFILVMVRQSRCFFFSIPSPSIIPQKPDGGLKIASHIISNE